MEGSKGYADIGRTEKPPCLPTRGGNSSEKGFSPDLLSQVYRTERGDSPSHLT